MYRYYKISPKWAEILGETETAVRHPDGMYLVTPSIRLRVIEAVERELGVRMLAEDAFEAIGAIGLTVAEAMASAKGELRHDRELDPSESIGNTDGDQDAPSTDDGADNTLSDDNNLTTD